jgi:thiol-disulfide isomerase/thioredoxin
MKKKFLIPLLLSAILSGATAAEEATSNTMHLTTVDNKKVDMKITDVGFNFEQFKGKAVLLDFFGPYCPPCLAEMPHLVDLQTRKKDDLVILGIQVQTQMSPDALKAFIAKKGLNYPIVNLDYAMELVQFIQANTNWGGQIPFMLLFNKEGKLVRTYLGPTEVSQIEQDMKK